MERLERGFYLRDTVTVARELLGKQLVHRVDGRKLAVEITETEAYTGLTDKACHSYGGRRTSRTQVLYLPGGHAYIYLIYGMYNLFNVVTEGEDSPCAVLIRGAKPVEGHDAIAGLRYGKAYADLAGRQIKSLLDGPGKLCTGLGLTRAHNALDLLGDSLYLCNGNPAPFRIGVSKRIGIDYAEEAADFPYRFYQVQE